MERRKFITTSTLTVFSVSAFGALNWNGINFEGDTATTTDILGPFYRPNAPIRTNLRLANSIGTPIILNGTIFEGDGKTPINNAIVEIWHCDNSGIYDNTSDEYKYRGGQRTKIDGKYEFKSILPAPYKADPNDELSWRPSHIHMRVSVPNQQDLITQIYFKNGKYIDTEKYASDPKAANRILTITETNSGESNIIFNVIMSKEIPLDQKVYDRVTGVFDIGESNFVEFMKNDDLLFMKKNGRLVSSLKYMGNNTFEGGIGFPKVTFELLPDGGTKVVVVTATSSYNGTKYLKY